MALITPAAHHLDDADIRSCSVRSNRVQCRIIAGLADRERHEDPDDVELDQPRHLRVEGVDEEDREAASSTMPLLNASRSPREWS
jgi:hypothetical protein